ncbi:MAG: MFS transporter, partial [Burkholderiaceae bacterium]|nr:MFS transporter [Burkholderiaceae bacterium]
MPAAFVVLMLALLLGTQPVVTDLYLPALPMLTQGFGASMTQAQLTLSGLLLAFGVSQLVWGPLSDRFGRRPILLLGLGAYVLCGAAAALAGSMAWLIVWRTAQGAAMGAAVMCARAIVRDLYTPFEGARAMSRALTGIGIIACASPTAGSLIAEHFGWRTALMVPALFGAITLVLIALRYRETAPPAQPRSLHPQELARTWARILRNPKFIAFSTLTIGTYGALFTLLAASSFVYIQVLGLSRTVYGLLMSGTALFYITGTVICRRMLPRFGVQRTVMLAAGVSLLGGTLA